MGCIVSGKFFSKQKVELRSVRKFLLIAGTISTQNNITVLSDSYLQQTKTIPATTPLLVSSNNGYDEITLSLYFIF